MLLEQWPYPGRNFTAFNESIANTNEESTTIRHGNDVSTSSTSSSTSSLLSTTFNNVVPLPFFDYSRAYQYIAARYKLPLWSYRDVAWKARTLPSQQVRVAVII